MPVKIVLKRQNSKNARIVAIDSSNSKILKNGNVGHYNFHNHTGAYKKNIYDKYLCNGAIPSKRVRSIIKTKKVEAL